MTSGVGVVLASPPAVPRACPIPVAPVDGVAKTAGAQCLAPDEVACKDVEGAEGSGLALVEVCSVLEGRCPYLLRVL